MRAIRPFKTALAISIVLCSSNSFGESTRLEPYSCFGKACNQKGKEALTYPYEGDCLKIVGNILSTPIDRTECKPDYKSTPFKAGSSIAFDFGSKESNSAKKSLYTLSEIKASTEGESPIAQIGYDLKFTYKSCPWAPNLWPSGYLAIDCGYNTVGKFPSQFFYYSTNGVGEINESDFMDVDLSSCTDDLVVKFRSQELCEMDVRLFEITIHQ